ncbi:MAG TPA: DUF1015 family protein [Candidatus Deferrimicrobium sp.]|nr:DUF1015 family protein [Candidatus Deferrimicrobium sp.]
MAVIRPLRGLRVRPEFAEQVTAPPYDVLTSDEARDIVLGNPKSFLRVSKPEVDFASGTPAYSDAIYRRGRENLERLIEEGLFCRDERPCFYLYRLTWRDQAQTGLVALSSIEEYNEGKIRRHEHTRPDKVNDRANHIVALSAQAEPVFSTFRYRRDVAAIFDTTSAAPPEYDFAANDVRHQLWVVREDSIVTALITAFGTITPLYIADGHHRSAAAAEAASRFKSKDPSRTGGESHNFFLNVFFPHTELRILPYHRVVRNMRDLTLPQLIEKAGTRFTMARCAGPVEPTKKYQFGLYCQHQWFELALTEMTPDAHHPAQSIDSAVLSETFLSPLLGIRDIRTDKRIDFVGGIRGVNELVRLVDSGEFTLAFSLPPATVEELLTVADAGEVMPPKSTWFEPKLRSGLVVNLLE